MARNLLMRQNPDDELLFRPDPKRVIRPDDQLGAEEIANALGVSPAEAKTLIDEGVLPIRKVAGSRNKTFVSGRDLESFISGLGSVDIDDKGPEEKNPRSIKKKEPAVTSKKAPAVRVVEEEAEMEEDEDEWDIVTCPKCKEEMAVSSNVLRFSCPSCGMELEIGDEEEEPEPGEKEEDQHASRNPLAYVLKLGHDKVALKK